MYSYTGSLSLYRNIFCCVTGENSFMWRGLSLNGTDIISSHIWVRSAPFCFLTPMTILPAIPRLRHHSCRTSVRRRQGRLIRHILLIKNVEALWILFSLIASAPEIFLPRGGAGQSENSGCRNFFTGESLSEAEWHARDTRTNRKSGISPGKENPLYELKCPPSCFGPGKFFKCQPMISARFSSRPHACSHPGFFCQRAPVTAVIAGPALLGVCCLVKFYSRITFQSNLCNQWPSSSP